MKAFTLMPQKPINSLKLAGYVVLTAILAFCIFQLVRVGQRAHSADIVLSQAYAEAVPYSATPHTTLKIQIEKNTGSTQHESFTSTYRPQVVRSLKQYLGLLGPDGSVNRSVPGWWLYANSQAEAEWLDYFGYPTPSEELLLARMSDKDLATLAAGGDLNAKSHRIARMTDEAFKSESIEKIRIVESLLGRLLTEGGPYQAFTVCRVYSELLQAFQDLPASEQTSKRKDILESYGRSAQLAYEIGSAYDDHTMMELQNGNIYGLRQQTGVANVENKTSIALARTLASMAARRREMNASPIILMARPETPRNTTFIPLERY